MRPRPLPLSTALGLVVAVAVLALRPAAAQTSAPAADGIDAPAPRVVMNLAAHPDDEDGRTLAYYRHAEDAVAYSVIFTRGEGGQNEIGPELYEALGALRTDETEAAARTLGTQVFFLNFKDFGFSKHADETFEAWGGRDAVTARVVRLFRTLKPDVVFTNHDTVTVGPNRQHGHHQAVGLAAYDAFALAADPTYHPEQLEEEGVDLWQPKRLFLRHWSEPERYDVAVPVDEPCGAEASATCTEIAGRALRAHRSQGMDKLADAFARRLEGPTYFTLLRSATDAPLGPHDLAANLPPHDAPATSLAYRIDAGRLPALDGVFTLSDTVAVPGERVRLRWDPEALPERRLRWVFSGAVDTTLYLSDLTPGTATLHVRPDATPTRPAAEWQYERFVSRPPVRYAVYRAATGELLAGGYLPLEIAPPLVLEAGADVVRLRSGANTLPIRVRRFDPAATRAEVALAVAREADRTVVATLQRTLTFGADDVAVDTLTFRLPDDLPEGAYTLALTALPTPATLAPAPVRAFALGRVFRVDVPAGLRVGLVQSYDNTLADALDQLGVPYRRLGEDDLANARFDGLHTIVVDIRAYLVRPDLRAHNDRLLAWVADGGHLVVNYQKTFEWNPGYDDPFVAGAENPAGFAPYPLTLGRDRVVREDAPVEVLAPDDALFHRPNRITASDWDGWVQERGLYFPEAYDPRYTELFALNDPGETPLRSSTLLAEYGDGTYLYTALVWYRQLGVLHPGAFALFANLISLPLTR